MKANKLRTVRPILLLLVMSIWVNTKLNASTAYTGMRNITAMQLVRDMGIGWNLGNSLDAHGTWASGLNTETMWSNPFTTKSMIDIVRQKGFKTIRIPVTWYMHMGGAPNYIIDDAWMDRVEEVVNFAFDNDMYVILNIHHEEYHAELPGSWLCPTYAKQAEVTDQLEKVWEQIANRFKNYGDYLIFETMNEPREKTHSKEWNGGTAEHRAVVNAFNLAAVNAIRGTGGNNANRFLMCPTHGACATPDAINDFIIPNNDEKVIVSLHNYAPFSFSIAEEEHATTIWGSANDKVDLENSFEAHYNKFISQGTAVIVGEWGTKDRNNTYYRTIHADYYVKEALSRNMVPIVWDDGAELKLLDRSNLNWEFTEIINAIVNASEDSLNVVVDGDFTDDSNWNLEVYNDGTGLFSEQNGWGYLDLNTATTNWYVQLSQVIEIQNGAEYSISFKAKAESNRNIMLSIQQTVAPYATLFSQAVNLTSSEQNFGPFTFTSPITSNQVKIAFIVGDNASDVFIDDVEMYQQNTHTPVTGVSIENCIFEDAVGHEFLTIGQTFHMDATVSPTNASNKNLVWSSSDTNVATVDQNGVVTARYYGMTTIKAESSDDPNYFATCRVDVDSRFYNQLISINARGNCGGEQMQLIINDEVVQTWVLTTSLDSYYYEYLLTKGPGDFDYDPNVKVAFINDAFVNGCDYNLMVDNIVIAGNIYQTEIAAERNGVGNSEWLWCNGNFDFGELQCRGYLDINVRALGSTGEEEIQLLVDDIPAATWSVSSTDFRIYSTSISSTYNNLKVKFTNNGMTSDNRDKNVRIDYVSEEGHVFEAEDQLVNTGVWQNGTCGGSYSEWLHCGGYIDFGNTHKNAEIVNNIVTNEEIFDLYPNPASDNITIEGEDYYSVSIIDMQGNVIIRDQKSSGNTNINIDDLPSGMYFVHYNSANSARVQKLVIEK